MATAPDRDWDAATYDRVSDVQLRWAIEQLARLDLRGDEIVLDAGCGSGRVTALLAQRLPRGRVYGVDVAPSMAAHAQRALGDRATVYCQDLVELSLPEPVDVAFSNATFHWIHDHDELFRALQRAIKPGGCLLAQCGGRGNIDSFREISERVAREEPFAPYFRTWRTPWNYATPEDTEVRLRRAGFADVSCWLAPKTVTPDDSRSFVESVCLVRHLDVVPQSLRSQFVDRVLERTGEPVVLEYVRLNMTAIRG
jgi:trans-aconitate 2-methyltransferase